jgi:hypothetical protein
MTSALLESPLFPVSDTRRVGPPGGGGTTLEERLEGAWRAVRADGQAECPVCRSRMRLQDGAGRCTGCGSTLS